FLGGALSSPMGRFSSIIQLLVASALAAAIAASSAAPSRSDRSSARVTRWISGRSRNLGDLRGVGPDPRHHRRPPPPPPRPPPPPPAPPARPPPLAPPALARLTPPVDWLKLWRLALPRSLKLWASRPLPTPSKAPACRLPP